MKVTHYHQETNLFYNVNLKPNSIYFKYDFTKQADLNVYVPNIFYSVFDKNQNDLSQKVADLEGGGGPTNSPERLKFPKST